MPLLPFELEQCSQECGKECGTATERCPVFSKLSEELQEVCKENPHLLQYLHCIPENGNGIPVYYEKVTRSLKGTKDPNLIYKVGDGVFVHICANLNDIRDYYIAIEPSLVDAQNENLDEIELRLADYVYIISKGKIEYESEPDKLKGDLEIKHRFLGV